MSHKLDYKKKEKTLIVSLIVVTAYFAAYSREKNDYHPIYPTRKMRDSA